MTLKQRTPKEKKAYLEGFNAAHKQFCEYLDTMSAIDAMDMMDILVKTLNTAVVIEPESEDADKKGQWRVDTDVSRSWDRTRFYCSKCRDWQTYGETRFCPNCGSPMEVSE